MTSKLIALEGGLGCDRRKEHNEVLLTRMFLGEQLVIDSFDNQWPARGTLKKNDDAIRRLFGGPHVRDHKKSEAV